MWRPVMHVCEKIPLCQELMKKFESGNIRKQFLLSKISQGLNVGGWKDS